MNFWKRHIGDFAKDTMHLSQAQVGAYDLMLDWYYANERPLPADVDDVYRIARAATKAERRNVEKVLREFFELGPDGYRQSRTDREIADKRAANETQAANGRKGGRPPKETRNEPERNQTGFSAEPDRNPSQNPESRDLSPSGERSGAPSAPVVPPCVDPIAWDDYLAHRRAKRAKATPRAIELLLAKLVDMHDRGLDPNEALRNSVEQGWTGVFDPKPRAGPGQRGAPLTGTAATIAALIGTNAGENRELART